MTDKQKEEICGKCLKRNTCDIIIQGSTAGCWESAVINDETEIIKQFSPYIHKPTADKLAKQCTEIIVNQINRKA